MTSKHAEILNALSAMQESIAYAARRHVLAAAERIIVEQEKQIASLEAERNELNQSLDEEFGVKPTRPVGHVHVVRHDDSFENYNRTTVCPRCGSEHMYRNRCENCSL